MCSFLIFNWLVKNIDYINYFLKFRGPDNTNVFNYKDFTFLHNLLHLTGKFTIQPFVNKKKDIVCLFNGEIYNYKSFGNYVSDGCCLIDLYIKYGIDFISKLDGEFAISLFDFKKDIFIISTDVFATKPLWYSINKNRLGISTYESALIRSNMKKRIKLLANTTLVFKISNLRKIEERRVFKFNFRQFKTNYNDWIKAFVESVKKRTDNDNYPVYVCLSSGYDSGVICCTLNLIKKKYYTYTILSNENENILKERIRKNKKYLVKSHLTDFELKEYREYEEQISKEAEDFKYECFIKKKNVIRGSNIKDDNACVGMAKICKLASGLKQRIFLSGSGADEIHCDYGFNGNKLVYHSCFGGKYPENLESIISNDPKKYCKVSIK